MPSSALSNACLTTCKSLEFRPLCQTDPGNMNRSFEITQISFPPKGHWFNASTAPNFFLVKLNLELAALLQSRFLKVAFRSQIISSSR